MQHNEDSLQLGKAHTQQRRPSTTESKTQKKKKIMANDMPQTRSGMFWDYEDL